MTALADATAADQVTSCGRALAANAATPPDFLELLPLRVLLLGNDMHVYTRADLTRSIIVAHARTAGQAGVALGLLDGWDHVTMPDQSVGEFLHLSAAAAA